jgi:hypothetical protein
MYGTPDGSVKIIAGRVEIPQKLTPVTQSRHVLGVSGNGCHSLRAFGSDKASVSRFRAQSRGRSGVRTVSENFTMACRRCQSSRVSSMVFDESISKISSICRATAGLRTSMLIS